MSSCLCKHSFTLYSISLVTSVLKMNFECLLVLGSGHIACWRLNIISDYDLLFFAKTAACLSAVQSNLPNCYFANYNPSKLDLLFLFNWFCLTLKSPLNTSTKTWSRKGIEQYICHDSLEFLLVFVFKAFSSQSSNLMIAFKVVVEHFLRCCSCELAWWCHSTILPTPGCHNPEFFDKLVWSTSQNLNSLCQAENSKH